MTDFNPKYGQDIRQINEKVKESSLFIQEITQELSKVIVGQRYLVERLLIAILANGHILIEGVPGLAKTLAVKTLSKCVQTKFQRIQFTSDMLPADITGVSVFDRGTGGFIFHPGPIFAQLILADEVNRATPKAQSALLEAMEERQVTAEGQTRPLPNPFFVIATQNPAHQIGTFPLPESQFDRFLMCIALGYPDRAAERELLSGADRRDMVAALAAGVDDYLITPLRSKDLLIRTGVLLRRCWSDSSSPGQVQFGPFLFNTMLGCVSMNEHKLTLTKKEFDLALLFFRHLGQPLSRATLLETLWTQDADTPSRTVDTHVSRVRSKLGLHPTSGFRLVPVYGYGYLLERVGE